MQSMKVLTAQVARFLPHGYRKREAYVDVRSAVNVDSYWDGGSRDEFRLLNENGAVLPLTEGQAPFRPNARGSDHVMQPGEILVRTGVFCGKTSTATVYFGSEEQLHRLVRLEVAVA